MPENQENNEKHPGGRPTKYRETFPQKVNKYITKCSEENVLPVLEELAVDILDVSPTLISTYCELYPEFLESVEKLKAIQKKMLIRLGLSEVYNASMAKFCLSANHGMAETENKNITGKLELQPPLIQ